MKDSSDMWAQDEFHFFGQRADEHVLMVKNQHPVIFAPKLGILAITLIIPWLLLRLSDGRITFLGIALYGIFFIAYLGFHWYAYQNSVSILSDQRIVSVLQKGFFHRSISEAELSRIQDVSSAVSGMFQTMFNYGNVTIRTASESLLVLKNINEPYEVQQAIVRALKGQNKGKE